VPVTPFADLVITKTPDVSVVANVGDAINYTILVNNDGNVNIIGLTVGGRPDGRRDGQLERRWPQCRRPTQRQQPGRSGRDLVLFVLTTS